MATPLSSSSRWSSPLSMLLFLAVLCALSVVIDARISIPKGVSTPLTMKDMGHTFLTPAAEAREMRSELLRLRREERILQMGVDARAQAQAQAEEGAEAGANAKHHAKSRWMMDDDSSSEWTDDRPHNESIFMPSECDYNTRSCCLIYEGEVCGGIRGQCKNVSIDNSVCQRSLGLFWFTDSFDFTCVCQGNYWGAACEECAPGWTGATCEDRANLLVRQDFAQLSDIDKQYAIDAFRLAKITPHPYQPAVSIYDYWALLHHWSLLLGVMEDRILLDGLSPMIAEGHGGGAIPYHRSLVRGMERALQYTLNNQSFAMPYWNWTGSAANDNDMTLQWFGGDGSIYDGVSVGSVDNCRQAPQAGQPDPTCSCQVSRGPFAGWPVVGDWAYHLNYTITRAFGCKTLDAPSTPSQLAAECAIRIDRFDVFTDSDVIPGHNDSEAAPNPYPDEPVVDPVVALRMHRNRNKRDAHTSLSSAAMNKEGDAVPAPRTLAKVGSVDPGVYFHNLLGGGVLCDENSNGGAATWPRGRYADDLHKRAHQWLTGTMVGNHPASDPIFWMLHSYADVIFEQWIRSTTYKQHFDVAHSWSRYSGAMGNTRMECQGPFYPLRTAWSSFVDSRDLGFTYHLFNDSWDKPELRPPYYDFQWHWSYPHMNPLDIAEEVALVQKDAHVVPEDLGFFVPNECGNVGSAFLSSDYASCCPLYNGLECGGTTRGLCLNLTDSDAMKTYAGVDIENHPDQLWWLTKSFTKACICSGNYDGVSCGSCKPGYSGDNCSVIAEKRVRRDFNTLSTDDMQYIVDAFRIARQAESLYQPGVSVLTYHASMVFWHLPGNSFASSTDSHPTVTYAHHGDVTWRRELLSRLESELGRITQNDSFVLPYWDWSTSYSNDLEPVYRWFGGDGNTNASIEEGLAVQACRVATPDGYGGCNCSITRAPFIRPPLIGLFGKHIGIVQRAFACMSRVAASLPSPAVVEHTAQIETYYVADNRTECFSKALTGRVYLGASVQTWPPGQHGDMLTRVQNYIAGTMAAPDLQKFRSVSSSPGSDPMYYLALAYGDLVFERWIRRAKAHGWATINALPITGAELGLNRGEAMAPFFPLKTNAQALRTSDESGYSYDFFDGHTDDHNFH